jgi:Lambda phage tail tube protein, TTP
MPTTPYVGIGDSFEFATAASPTTYTTLNGVTNVAISGDKVSTEKTTTMATTNGVDTFIAGTQDPGTCDVKGLFYPGDTTMIALEAIRLSGVAVPIKVLYGSSNSCSFSGIVESLTPAFPLDKPATLDVKVKISGPKTYV